MKQNIAATATMKTTIIIIVLIIIGRGRGKEGEREGNKTQEKQAMLNVFTHHTFADVQPIPRPAAFSLCTGHDVLFYGIPSWPLWARCPSHAPTQLLATLAEHRKLKIP